MSEQAKKSRRELTANLLASCGTGIFSISISNPINTFKIRWQVVGATSTTSNGPTMFGMVRRVLAEEGVWRGLWRPGLAPGLVGSVASIGLRYGLYPTIRDTTSWALDTKSSKIGPAGMFASGLASGMIGYFLASPFLMIMTQVQAEAGRVGPDGRYKTGARIGHFPVYPHGTLQALHVRAASGAAAGGGVVGALRELWRGSSVVMLRGGVLNASQLAAYDTTKTQMKALSLMSDGPALHVLASTAAAISATTCSMPLDVVLTFYQSAQNFGGAHFERYGKRGPLACAFAMLQDSGPSVFMRGWLPNFARLTPICVLSMWVYEQLRQVVGIGYLD